MIVIDKNTSETDFLNLLLKNRHIKDNQLNEFLKPTSPLKFSSKEFGVNQKQLNQAVKLIEKNIQENKNILIYGDYDVDGITATAILWQVLYQKKAHVLPYIPHREKDGYGIKAKSFFNFESQKKIKFDLLITVDNGIVAEKELEKILKSGTEVIVTDHHVGNQQLPQSIITIHSTKISGAAVAWLLAKELNCHADMSLAALGTVADCLPLNNINRNIVFHGIKKLNSRPDCGIQKLLQISNVEPGSVSSYHLGFILGPRINAVGRLSDPTDALRLLCCSSPTLASKLSRKLDSFNQDRQKLQQESIALAQDKIPKNFQDKVIFIADKSFHPGIIGLISGRLTEEYYLPSIIISIDGDTAKGSCRSIKELNIIESLRQCGDDLIELGGHAGAAGFTIASKNIPQFRKNITQIINHKLENKKLKASSYIDAEMKLSAVNIKNCKLLQKLEPFGIANPEPIFLFKNIKIIQKRTVGQNQAHLKLKLDDPNTKTIEKISAGIDAIAFKKGNLDQSINIGDFIDFTARLKLNIWNNNVSSQLVINDILK